MFGRLLEAGESKAPSLGRSKTKQYSLEEMRAQYRDEVDALVIPLQENLAEHITELCQLLDVAKIEAVELLSASRDHIQVKGSGLFPDSLIIFTGYLSDGGEPFKIALPTQVTTFWETRTNWWIKIRRAYSRLPDKKMLMKRRYLPDQFSLDVGYLTLLFPPAKKP